MGKKSKVNSNKPSCHRLYNLMLVDNDKVNDKGKRQIPDYMHLHSKSNANRKFEEKYIILKRERYYSDRGQIDAWLLHDTCADSFKLQIETCDIKIEVTGQALCNFETYMEHMEILEQIVDGYIAKKEATKCTL